VPPVVLALITAVGRISSTGFEETFIVIDFESKPLPLLAVRTTLNSPVDVNTCSGFASDTMPLPPPKFYCKSAEFMDKSVNFNLMEYNNRLH
jgi:hypothetical protein